MYNNVEYIYLHNMYLILSGPTHGKIVVCYIGTWAVYRPDRGSFSIEHIDPTLCTHLVYSFAGLNVSENTIKSLGTFLFISRKSYIVNFICEGDGASSMSV